MNTLEKRCVELSYKHKLSHISSVLNTVNVLDKIYGWRESNDPVVLGNAHAGLALYVVLEAHGFCDAEEMLQKHGIHSTRDIDHGVFVSGGSLGQAETVAVGIAISNPKNTVWLVTSDGACSEGALMEAFRIAREQNVTNLNIDIIANGFGAYRTIDVDILENQLRSLLGQITLRIHRCEQHWPWLQGLQGHYNALSVLQYCHMMGLRTLCSHGLEFFLTELPKQLGNYMEIGIFEGYLISELAKTFPEKKFFGIDPFIEDGYTMGHTGGKIVGEKMVKQRDIAQANCAPLTNVRLFEQSSRDFAKEIDNDTLWAMDISAVLVDGDHHYEHASNDMNLAGRALKNGGVIYVDDMGLPDVKRAVDEFVSRKKARVEDYKGGGIIRVEGF